MKNLPLLAVLALVAALPEVVLASSSHHGNGADLGPWQAAAYVTVGVAAELAYAAALAACFQRYLFPKRILSVDALINAVLPRLLPFFFTRLLINMAILSLGVAIPRELLRTGASSGSRAIGAALCAASILLALRLAITWILVPVILIVERKSFVQSMLRSAELMRTKYTAQHWIDSPMSRALLGLAPSVIAGLSILASVQVYCIYTHRPLLNFPSLMLGESPYRYAACLTRGMFELLCAPLFASFITLLYMECRMRREGVDFQVRLLENNNAGLVGTELPDLS